MNKLLVCGLLATLFFVVKIDIDTVINGELVSDNSETEFESSQEFLDAIHSNSLKEFKLNNESKPLAPTNLTLSMTNCVLKCSIDNLVPNNGYVVTFFRNDIAFGYYRVRAYDVRWSSMNLHIILDFYPSKGALGAYPNFTVDISADSKLYGDYQCSVKLLGIQKDDNEIHFNSNKVVIVNKKTLTPKLKWLKVFPVVNITFGMDNTEFDEETIYEAKCKIRFDRPVNEYIVYFMASNKVLGAYMVETDPAKVKWQLFSRNLLESRHNILELEEESSYPNYSVLLKMAKPDVFGCKIEIPSKKHPISYYSNTFDFVSKIAVSLYRSNNVPVCKVEFGKFGGSYELSVVHSNNKAVVDQTLGTKTAGGDFAFLERSSFTLQCKVEYNGQVHYSEDSA